MRYYYYISDSKVDMLLPQIPNALQRKFASEIGFDIKILKGSIKEQRDSLSDRVSRLQTVEKYLRKNVEIGNSLDSTWFGGEMFGSSVMSKQAPNAVFFWGEFENCLLLMGGSAKHLIGCEELKTLSKDIAVSFLPKFLSEIMATISSEKFELLHEEEAQKQLHRNANPENDDPVKVWQWTIKVFDSLSHFLPKEGLEFIAKRLFTVEVDGSLLAIATPLFVAAV